MKLFNMQLSRKQYQRVMIVLAAALILTGFFAYNTYTEKKQYQTFLQNTYQRSFRDLVSDVENIKVLLDKAEVSASPLQSNALMSQTWMKSFSAAENLGQLPITHTALSKTQKFLSQVGDYSYTLSRLNAQNKVIDNKQMDQLSKLNSYAGYLLEQLHGMEEDVAQGKIKFGEMRKEGRIFFRKASQNAAEASFGKLEDKFSDYPTMIYDGPFSDNVVEGKPKGELGAAVNLRKAEEAARRFVGDAKVGKIIETSSGKGKINTFGLEIIPKDNDRSKSINIDITKNGGHVLWMLNPREVPEKKLTNQQASDIAKKFLKQQGFGNLTETYYLNNDNTTVITYVGVTDNGILIYPDLLKVKVALDNGEVVGFDANQYLSAHRKRNLPKPKLTSAEAQKKISQKLTIERVKLAVIPIPGDNEQLCYEFKGKYKNNDYFVYINAENGNEENILRIIKDENGILTQ
ncbi:MAG: germination protein YpeB [Caulobacteraceae bacterium]